MISNNMTINNNKMDYMIVGSNDSNCLLSRSKPQQTLYLEDKNHYIAGCDGE